MGCQSLLGKRGEKGGREEGDTYKLTGQDDLEQARAVSEGEEGPVLLLPEAVDPAKDSDALVAERDERGNLALVGAGGGGQAGRRSQRGLVAQETASIPAGVTPLPELGWRGHG